MKKLIFTLVGVILFSFTIAAQERSDEEIDEILKSFPKDYFVEGGEDMFESFSMTDK